MAPDTHSIRFHEAHAPLYVVAFDGVPTDEEFQRYLDWMVDVAQRGDHAMVLDATHAGLLPPSQRQMQSRWMREYDELNRERTVAMSFVLPNPLLRGLLTALLWAQPMPCPFNVVSRRRSALDWCDAQLRNRGIRPAKPLHPAAG